MSLVPRLPREIHLCRSSSIVPRLPSVLNMLQNPHVWLTFDKVQNPSRLPRKTASELRKIVRDLQFLTLRNALRARTACNFSNSELPKVDRNCQILTLLTFDFDVCFALQQRTLLNISTDKNAPNPQCFEHVRFQMCQMCFTPQSRALLQHLSFQKCSGADVLCAFWLRHVLRATAACTFSTSQLPKMLRQLGASRHSRVQFFISHPARWLRTRRFSEPTFRPSRALGLFDLVVHLDLLSTLSFLTLLFWLFSSLTALNTVAVNFLR